MADEKSQQPPNAAAAPPIQPVDDAGLNGSDPSKTHTNVIEHARAAAHKEQKMTLMQGIRLYPKAIAWSVLISTCIAMEGYDISLVNNFCKSHSLTHSPLLTQLLTHSLNPHLNTYLQPLTLLKDAFPEFKKKYGVLGSNGEYEIPAPWQAGLSNVC